MKTGFDYIVTDPNGLHARPAGLFVKKAQQMTAEITVECNQKQANGKKLLAVMGLGIRNGDRIRVTVEGDSAEQLSAELQRFVQKHL